MNNGPARRSSLFLMELIMAILFFCLASAVCVQFFVKSHLVSQDTQNLTMAVNQVSGVAEMLKSNGDTRTALTETYPYIEQMEDDIYLVYYNRDWKETSEGNACYYMSIMLSAEEGMEHVDLGMYSYEESDTIYELSVDKHLPNTMK